MTARPDRPDVLAPDRAAGPSGFPLRLTWWPWWIAAPALAIALAVAVTWWVQRASDFERFRAAADPGAEPIVAWFVWSLAPGGEDPAVVALEPGGEPLAGHWAETTDRYYRTRDLVGGGSAEELAQEGAPGKLVRWRGRFTGARQKVGDDDWSEFVRAGRAIDFDVLGQDPDLAGRWRSPGLPYESVDLRPDGRMVNDRGVECGRWAGHARVLLLFTEQVLRRPDVLTLVRQEPSWLESPVQGRTVFATRAGGRSGATLYRDE